MAQIAALLREVTLDRAAPASGDTGVRAQDLVVAVNRDRLRRAAHPELLVQEAPRRRVEGAVDLDMAVAVQGRGLPDDGIPARRRQRQQCIALAFLEELGRPPSGRAVSARRRDLREPAPQSLAVVIDV